MSDHPTLLFLCGSLRPESTSLAMLYLAEDLLADRFVVDHYDRLDRLPHFNPDDDRDPLDPVVADLRRRVDEAAAILICTPQYAAGLPGSLKNLLDWTIRSVEICAKPVAWIDVSGSAGGAALAHEALRASLYELGATVVLDACLHVPVTRDMIDDSGVIADSEVSDKVAAALEVLVERIGRTSGAE